MRYRLVGLPHYRGSRPGLVGLWREGEERELPAEAAAYMAATFPGALVLVEDGHAEAMVSPPADRAMRSPRRVR
jgi:hypothetical protein